MSSGRDDIRLLNHMEVGSDPGAPPPIHVTGAAHASKGSVCGQLLCNLALSLAMPLATTIIVATHTTNDCDALLYEFLMGCGAAYVFGLCLTCFKQYRLMSMTDPFEQIAYQQSTEFNIITGCHCLYIIFLLAWTIVGLIWYQDAEQASCDDDIVKMSLAIIIINFVAIPCFFCLVCLMTGVILGAAASQEPDHVMVVMPAD